MIIINDSRKIIDIKEEFNSLFPYLKIEFFTNFNNQNYTNKLIKKNSNTLGECRTIQNNLNITITPTTTVADLDFQFRKVYGLKIELYRKSGKEIWLETTLTDSWTLEEQNRQGEALSKK